MRSLRLGYFCDFITGHLNPMLAMASQMKKQGYENIFFAVADSEAAIRKAGHEFRLIGHKEFPLGSKQRFCEEISRWRGSSAVKNLIRHYCQQTAMTLRDGFDAARKANIDALIVDQNQFAGGTVADRLRIPFINLIPTAPPNENRYAPHFIFYRKYQNSTFAQWRNQFEYFMIRKLLFPILQPINEQRHRWRLPLFRRYDDTFSRVLQLCQMPEAFEFPHKIELSYFEYCGPFIDASSRPWVEFPWDKLNGKPLIYASLGTVMTMLSKANELFTTIIESCSGLETQLVLSLGGSSYQLAASTKAMANKMDAIVVPYAPQLELISRASAVIGHGGLNSTLETITKGVPLVAIPLGFDQAGVSARLRYHRAGIVQIEKQLNPASLRRSLLSILTEPHYRLAAKSLADKINKVNGLQRCAEKIKTVLTENDSSPSILKNNEDLV
jgi:zeaxanthin glucosyltransferase